jgi:hypothetical protein
MDGEFVACMQDCSLHILNMFGVLGGGDSQAAFRKYNWRVAVRSPAICPSAKRCHPVIYAVNIFVFLLELLPHTARKQ